MEAVRGDGSHFEPVEGNLILISGFSTKKVAINSRGLPRSIPHTKTPLKRVKRAKVYKTSPPCSRSLIYVWRSLPLFAGATPIPRPASHGHVRRDSAAETTLKFWAAGRRKHNN